MRRTDRTVRIVDLNEHIRQRNAVYRAIIRKTVNEEMMEAAFRREIEGRDE